MRSTSRATSILLLILLLSFVFPLPSSFFFFFNDTATTEIYTLSLHDALPICAGAGHVVAAELHAGGAGGRHQGRSEEHTSELQSRVDLVCRLLLEKKKTQASWSIRLPPTTSPRRRACAQE